MLHPMKCRLSSPCSCRTMARTPEWKPRPTRNERRNVMLIRRARFLNEQRMVRARRKSRRSRRACIVCFIDFCV